VGANDATHTTSYATYQRDLDDLKNRLLASGASQILWATPPDMGYSPALPLPLRLWAGVRSAHFAQALRETAAAQPRIHVVDLFADGALTKRAEYAADLFHPAPASYERWGELFVRQLR
jgi:lysophospholipase L1-like esterase